MALALALVGAAGCGGRRSPVLLPSAGTERPDLGVYRARVEDASGRSRRFKLLLFASLPDRIHAEVVAPVGGTLWILDGGGGRLAVIQARQGVAYLGSGDAGSVERVLGIGLSIEALVDGLLNGASSNGACRTSRSPGRQGRLPDRLEVRCPTGGLILRLRRLEPLRVSQATLGTGAAPDGMETRPLEDLTMELPGSRGAS